MENKVKKAVIRKTGEEINVYKLESGGYYDYDNMSHSKPPKAKIANKKQFDVKELHFVD